MTPSLLITSISKKVPLINAVKAACKKLYTDFSIHGSDIDAHCIARYMVDFFWQPSSESPITREQIRDYCHHHNITMIIPTRNGELEFFARNSGWFREREIHIMISPLHCIEICIDKLRFANWGTGNHFPMIQTELDLYAIREHNYVVKERFGAGSGDIAINVSQQAAIEHSNTLKCPVFQPYLIGLEYSVDVYIDKSSNVKGCVVRSRDKIANGESQITTTIRKPMIEELCAKVAKSLHAYGHIVFQVIEKKDQSLHIVECNPRFGGASTASLAVGLDSFYWFLLESSGKILSEQSFHRLNGEIRQVRYPADKIIML